MPVYIVTPKAGGIEVFRYSAEAAVEWQGFEFATHDHTVYVEPQPPAPPPPPPKPPIRISRLAFLKRFTDPEAITFDLAGQGATPQAAGIRRYMQLVNAAEYIDLEREDTRTGVQTLEAMALIAKGRAAVILDTPPTETEVYRG